MLFFALVIQAQSVPCEYRLELFDNGGDGWNGANLVVTVNGEPRAFTLNNIDDDGIFATFQLPVMDGDTVTISFIRGSANAEIAYAFFSPTGVLLARDIAPLGSYSTDPFTVPCPSCPPPPPNSILIEDVAATTTDVTFRLSDPDGQYLIEYGASGFAPGSGTTLVNFSGDTTLAGLSEKTMYDLYIAAACANGDTSVALGPFSFETLWSIDVGVSGLVTPVTGCALSSDEEVLVILKNYGGDPQSLIPFKYNVNGIDAAITMPQDGLYTGVLSRDSTDDAFPFDARWDFSVPQEYTITAWTELEDDRDNSNDTTVVTITNIPFVTEYPYYENFEEWSGGWTVDVESENSSWELGQPNANTINRAFSGNNAWVTNLEGFYANNEQSYLLSPCLDFSAFSEDPTISFFFNFLTEFSYDFLWLESSIDGGETWSKVGAFGTGTNWYNDPEEEAWTGDANTEGWSYVSNILAGLAGQPDVRLRFVFDTDPTSINEGVGLDDIFIGVPLENDLIAVNLTNIGEECGSAEDLLTIVVGNYGQNAQDGFQVSYQVNGGETVTEEVTGISLAPGEQINYTFQTPFNSSPADTYEILAWADLENENLRLNDTTRLVFTNVLALPFAENFETPGNLENWVFDVGTTTTRGHGNTSSVLFDNLWSNDPVMTAVSPSIGPITPGDSLSFEYRYVDFDSPFPGWELAAGDTLSVGISTDCGETFETIYQIHAGNHQTTREMTRVRLSLEDYVGLGIKIRFLARGRVATDSDYYIDLDNVQVFQCRDLELSAVITGTSAPDAADGNARVTPGAGLAPYTYSWSTGDQSSTAAQLLPGDYSVTVTDQLGCSSILAIQVDLAVSTQEPEWLQAFLLAPNPTTGIVNLQIPSTAPADLHVELLDMVGRVLRSAQAENIRGNGLELDLGPFPNGLYFVRIVAGEHLKTLKVVKQ